MKIFIYALQFDIVTWHISFPLQRHFIVNMLFDWGTSRTSNATGQFQRRNISPTTLQIWLLAIFPPFLFVLFIFQFLSATHMPYLLFFVCFHFLFVFYISDSTEFPIGNTQFHPMVDCQSLFPIQEKIKRRNYGFADVHCQVSVDLSWTWQMSNNIFHSLNVVFLFISLKSYTRWREREKQWLLSKTSKCFLLHVFISEKDMQDNIYIFVLSITIPRQMCSPTFLILSELAIMLWITMISAVVFIFFHFCPVWPDCNFIAI